MPPDERTKPVLDPQADPYPLIAIVGPTASGKSDLGLAVAERFSGEVVNYDSVQVYRGFDIGSAKLPAGERRGIPHHALDVVDPDDVFTAGDYARLARPMLDAIRGRGRLPVLVGGTGFYLRALLEGLFPGPGRDEALRERLSNRAEDKPEGYLHRLLSRLDAASAARIHPRDTPKLIRAIEVCLLGGKPMSELLLERRDRLVGYRTVYIGLDPPRELLYDRIERRVHAMFEQGLVEEVRHLLARGVSPGARPFAALGYSEALEHVGGELGLPQAIELTIRMTRRYAKRQMTWFRRESDVEWFRGFGDSEEIQREVLEFGARALSTKASKARS